MLLRTGVFAMRAPQPLKLLIPGRNEESRGEAWKAMVEQAKQRDKTTKISLKERREAFPSRSKLDASLKSLVKKRMRLAIEDEFFRPCDSHDDYELLLALLSAHTTSCRGRQMEGSTSPWIEENRGEISRRMAGYVASDKYAATVALEEFEQAQQIWGFEWRSVMEEHVAAAKQLETEAKLFGLKAELSPDPSLFDPGPELDPATRQGLEELTRSRRTVLSP